MTDFIEEFQPEKPRVSLVGSNQDDLTLDILGKTTWAGLPKKSRNEEGLSIVRSFYREVKPDTPIEGMIYGHLFALNAHISELMNDAWKLPSIDMRERYLKLTCRMLTVFSNTLDGLDRFKRGGRQTIRVENVNVCDGGQAIVGSVVDQKKTEKEGYNKNG